MTDKCKVCNRLGINGWVLVDGWCRYCNPDAWESRRLKLREQARQLIEDSTHAPEPTDERGLTHTKLSWTWAFVAMLFALLAISMSDQPGATWLCGAGFGFAVARSMSEMEESDGK